MHHEHINRLRVDILMSTVDFRYSRDGGHNWSAWRQKSLGDTGDFVKRVEMRQFGQGQQWVFDIRVTDNGKADLLGAATMIEGGQS